MSYCLCQLGYQKKKKKSTWKQFTCPLSGEWTNRGPLSSAALHRGTNSLHTAICVHLQGVMLMGRNQTQKATCCMIGFIYMSFWKRQNIGERFCWDWGQEDIATTSGWRKGIFSGGNGTVLYLKCGDCTTLNLSTVTELYTKKNEFYCM